MERVVVCFRWRGARPEALAKGGAPNFEWACRELLRRREVLGGRIVAWYTRSFSFDFPADSLEDAIQLVVDDGGDETNVLAGFGVGISEGEVVVHFRVGTEVALGTGSAVERATALASIASRGEVLLEPMMEAVRSGQLLTQGSTMGTTGGQRVRGQRLDQRFPWRRPESLACSPRPALVGRAPHELVVEAGHLALVVAPRGCGGTRFMMEVASLLSPPVLSIEPWQVGEPLGGLRDAFRRASLQSRPELSEAHEASIEALLAGEGLDVEESAALIRAWVGSTGAVLLDDAGEVDRDTMEAAARACRDHSVLTVARVLDSGHLPSMLGDLPRSGTLTLEPLGTTEAEAIVRESAASAIHENAVVRWARRGGGRPLAILEAVRFGLESAELVHEHDSVVPRNRIGGRGGAQPARHWILGRMRFLEDDARAALDAMVVLGGQASPKELIGLLDLVGVDVSFDALTNELKRSGWVNIDAGGVLSLSSATLRDVLHELLPIERRSKWHIAAAQLRSESDAPLAAARAAFHAFMSGEPDLLTNCAKRAAGAARAAGLEATAFAYDQLAAAGDVSLLLARGLTGGISPRRPTRSSQAPPSGPSLHVEGTVGGLADDGLPGKAAAALRRGDLDAVGALAKQLRDETANEALAERLEAMAFLRRGETSEALRLLRGAKARAARFDAEERCRAALAYGVALSSAGRRNDALLEGLEALARAREVGDHQGERACARFLAQLNEQAGHHEFARAWRALTE